MVTKPKISYEWDFQRYYRNVLRETIQGKPLWEAHQAELMQAKCHETRQGSNVEIGTADDFSRAGKLCDIICISYKGFYWYSPVNYPLHSMIIELQEDSHWIWCTFRKESFREKSKNVIKKRYQSIINPISASIPGIITSPLDCGTDDDAIVVEYSNLRYVHRLIATDMFIKQNATALIQFW